MSASIRAPWIYECLLQTAEQHGAHIGHTAPETKPRKAQLIQWLTYPRGDSDDVFLWAILSDKVHTIHVRFSKEAVKAIRQNPIFAGRNVTEYRTSMITVKQFRPFCTRVPLGRERGMSNSDHIALEVHDFNLPGSFNEPAWGSPAPIESHPDIYEWIKGLRQGGGAGNVLKLRKIAQLQDTDAADNEQVAAQDAQQSGLLLNTIPRKTKLTARKPAGIRPPATPSVQQSESARAPTDARLAPEELYRNKWKPFVAITKHLPDPNIIKGRIEGLPLSRPNNAPAAHDAVASYSTRDKDNALPKPSPGIHTPRKHRRRDALDLGTSEPNSPVSLHPEEPEGQAAMLPVTPSHWSPSNQGSPRTDAATFEAIEEETRDGMAGVRHNNSAPTSPSASQLELRPSHPPVKEEEGPSLRRTAENASPNVANAAMIPEPTSSYLSAPTPAQRPRPALPSSPLQSTSAAQEISINAVLESPLAIPSSSGHLFTTTHPLQQRRVPRPICNRLFPDLDVSGPGRILVPNSDTSASLSQDQPFSQPSQQNSASQGSSQQQKRSQQSLSYATGSQGENDFKSQGSQQSRSRLRIEVAAAEEAANKPATSDVDMKDEQTNKVAESCSQPMEDVRLPSPLKPVSKETSVQDGHPMKPSQKVAPLERTSSHTRHKVSRPSQQFVPDSESETEEDTGDERDELDSIAHVPAIAPPRPPSLDSDDERTKAMVDRYTSASATGEADTRKRQTSSTVAVQAGSASPQKRSAAPRRLNRMDRSATSFAHSHNSDLPLPPSSPDVFMSEASFHASHATSPRDVLRPNKDVPISSTPRHTTTPIRDTRGSSRGVARDTGSSDRTRVDKPHTPIHDAAAWMAPAFLRKPIPPQRDKSPSKSVADSRTKPTKRAITLSSDSEPEEPPKKRQKTSAVIAARTSGWVKAVTQELAPQPMKSATVPAVPSRPTKPDAGLAASSSDRRPLAGPATKLKQLDLRRSASVLSSTRPVLQKRSSADPSASPEKRGAVKPEVRIVRQLSPGGSTPIEVKHVDFAAGSGKSSSATASKARMKSRTSAESAGSSRHSHTVSAIHHGAPPIGDRRGGAEPGPSAVRASGMSVDPRESGKPMPHDIVWAHEHSGDSSSTSAQAGPSTLSATALQPVPERLLGGYQVNFDMTVEEGGPQLITWSKLQEILLRTGRARHKLKSKGCE